MSLRFPAVLPFVATALLVAACSNPEGDANAAVTGAKGKYDASTSLAPDERVTALEEIRATLAEIPTKYPSASVAVKILGGEPVAGLTDAGLEGEIALIHKDACAETTTSACLLDLSFALAPQMPEKLQEIFIGGDGVSPDASQERALLLSLSGDFAQARETAAAVPPERRPSVLELIALMEQCEIGLAECKAAPTEINRNAVYDQGAAFLYARGKYGDIVDLFGAPENRADFLTTWFHRPGLHAVRDIPPEHVLPPELTELLTDRIVERWPGAIADDGLISWAFWAYKRRDRLDDFYAALQTNQKTITMQYVCGGMRRKVSEQDVQDFVAYATANLSTEILHYGVPAFQPNSAEILTDCSHDANAIAALYPDFARQNLYNQTQAINKQFEGGNREVGEWLFSIYMQGYGRNDYNANDTEKLLRLYAYRFGVTADQFSNGVKGMLPAQIRDNLELVLGRGLIGRAINDRRFDDASAIMAGWPEETKVTLLEGALQDWEIAPVRLAQFALTIDGPLGPELLGRTVRRLVAPYREL